MNAKQYLRQVRRLDNTVNAKLEQVEVLRAMTTRMTANLTADKVQESNILDKIPTLICKIVDLENEITNDIDKLIDLKTEVMRKIDSIQNDDYRLLLTLRYLNFKTWEQIAVEMNFDYSWIHRLHAKALIQFDELMVQEATQSHNKI
jgi:DNA-directed RNA polymerase specialized sigma subunit